MNGRIRRISPLSLKAVLSLTLLLFFKFTFAGVLQRPTLIRLGQEAGFPQVGTNLICEDKEGKIWITSEFGDVVCYDGYDIVFSRKFHNISTPFYSSNANTLFFVSEGVLYSIPDSKSEPNPIETEHEVSCIGDAPDGIDVVLVSSNHICLYNPASGCQYWKASSNSLSNVKKVQKYGQDCFMSGTWGRLYRIDLNKGKVRVLRDFHVSISYMTLSPDNHLWVATLGEGLFDYNPANGECVRYSEKEGLSSNYIHTVCFDRKGRVWIGSKQGLDILDLSDSSITVCMRDQYNMHSLSHDTVRRLFLDSQGGMWIGTYFGGIDYWHESFDCFKTIVAGKGDESLSDFVVSSIAESADGLIWIGTNRGGLNSFNPVTGKVTCYPIPQSSRDACGDFFNNVQDIWCHPDGRRLFLATNGNGLIVFDRGTGRFTRLNTQKIIYSITPDAEGANLILGTTSDRVSLSSYNIGNNTSHKISNGAFRVIYKDSRGLIWTRPKLHTFSSYVNGNVDILESVLPDEYDMTCAAEDRAGHMWFGGENGLLFFDRNTAPTFRFGKDDIPPVNSLQTDDSGALWIGTVAGLYRYSVDNEEIKKYEVSDGLASNYFCEKALFKTSDGLILAGGVGGLTIVFPERIEQGKECPAPVISAIYVNEKEYIPDSDRIVFGHKQNVLSFRLSTPDYSALRRNKFQYRLEGYDTDWYSVGSDRVVTYKNLPRGRYSLSIRVSRDSVNWSESLKAVSFRKRPVWYASVAAILLWTVLFTLGMFLLVTTIIRHKTLRSKLLLYEMEEKYASEKRKLKTLKFINTSPSIRKENRTEPIYDILPKDELFLSRAIETMERNISNPDFGVDELASALKISRMTLHTKMKELTSDSTLKFIHKIRFTEACRLLTETNLSINEICYKVGGKSPSNFAASFKNYIGCTPQQYARSNRR